MENQKSYKLFKIKDGTVIDHIPSPMGLSVFKILSKKPGGIVSIGLNFTSKELGKKDLIKYENVAISKTETDKIALIAPKATINIIKDSEVVEKRRIDVPKKITNTIKCKNPKCITNIEKDLNTDFDIIENKPVKVSCKYCERIFTIDPKMLIED